MRNPNLVKPLLALGLLTLPVVGCQKSSDGGKKGAASGASADEEASDFDESQYSNEERLLDPEFGQNVMSPDSPSTSMILESNESDSRIIDVNLSVNVWGAGSNSTITTNLMLQYAPGIMLMRHTPKGDNAIFDAEGKIIWKDDNRTIAQCTYDAMVLSTATGVGALAANPKIPFLGTGGGVTLSFEKTVEDMGIMSGSSNNFPVRKGEEIDTIQQLCRSIFDAANKAEIDRQMKTLIEKKFIMDQREGFEKVMKQALGGPKDLLKNVNGLEFNVDDVLAKVKNGGKEVVGGIKDVGSSVGDKVGGIIPKVGLNLAAISEEPSGKFDLCFTINLSIDNTILKEEYNDCKGGAIDSEDPTVKRAIEVAQEIGMTAGQYGFSSRQFGDSKVK